MIKQVKILPARELVASEIRKAILTGKFEAGEELRQDKIAEMLGVSRMPVREAINILSNEGLLITSPNRSAVVAEIPANYIKEHFDVRILLECEAAARATTRFKSIDEILSIHEQHGLAIETSDIDQVHRFNQALHIMIWDTAENTKMKAFLLQLWNGLSLPNNSKSLTKSQEEHDAIIKAFQERNQEKARVAMKKHLESSMRAMLNSQKINIDMTK